MNRFENDMRVLFNDIDALAHDRRRSSEEFEQHERLLQHRRHNFIDRYKPAMDRLVGPTLERIKVSISLNYAHAGEELRFEYYEPSSNGVHYVYRLYRGDSPMEFSVEQIVSYSEIEREANVE